MHIIIDADPIVYRAGFAAETHSYHCVVEWGDGHMSQEYFSPHDSKTAGDLMKEFKANYPDAKIVDKQKHVECEPLNFALRGVKMTIEACIKDATKELQNRTLAPDFHKPSVTVLLSGPGNFRDELATIKKYKGNRDPEHKPVYYQDIRDYLCKVWGAEVIEGHEADDECSIRARLHDTDAVVVCTVDKDLDQIPGHHYDYSKKVFYTVLPSEAEYLFWRQCISGDGVDNIQGLYRVGETVAQKKLDAILEVSDDSVNVWANIVQLYMDNIERYPDKYPEGMSGYQAALENARLVKMQEYRNQLWTPPGVPDEVTT